MFYKLTLYSIALKTKKKSIFLYK